MSEHRREILKMLAEGQINVDEAERLIAASEKSQPAANEERRPKYLRVVVNALDGKGTKVNVRAPMQLLRAGVRLASLIPPQAREQVNDAMREKGVDIDLSQIKPENLEELVNQLEDISVDVDEKDTKIRVFCE